MVEGLTRRSPRFGTGIGGGGHDRLRLRTGRKLEGPDGQYDCCTDDR
jgi:hypothetical protein